MVSLRSIYRTILAFEQAEGVGAKVRRSIGTMKMRNFDPFLMLDHFNVSPDAGFPEHPHLGQETVTYVTHGQMAHEDFNNHLSVLNEGDLQFMTAGRGIVHSEMPVRQPDNSNVVGMQLWVDLPANLKETEPRYRDLRKNDIPVAKVSDKVSVKVISGEVAGVKSVADLAYTPMFYYHYYVQPGGKFTQPVDPTFNCFLYILGGGLRINGTDVDEFNSVFFNQDGDAISAEVPEDGKPTNFIFVGGKKLNQKVIQHGPFVASNQERIIQGFQEYQSATNAFKPLRTWKTDISNGIDSETVEQLVAAKAKVRDEL